MSSRRRAEKRFQRVSSVKRSLVRINCVMPAPLSELLLEEEEEEDKEVDVEEGSSDEDADWLFDIVEEEGMVFIGYIKKGYGIKGIND